jgi:glycosyltransferase involved in cell wall biosynthesis
MGTLPKTILVVPCYNEARRLVPDAFLETAAGQHWLSMLFIDDGSTDDTARLLEQLCARRPRQLSFLRLPANGGKAEAVRQGVLRACQSDAEVVGFWDADLSAPLAEVRPMVELLAGESADLVLGSRVKLLGHEVVRSVPRHYLGRIFATVTSLVLDLAVYDTQCGAKLLRNNEHARRAFAAPFESRWIFDVEILDRLLSPGRAVADQPRIVEYPLAEWKQGDGSRLRPSDFARAAIDLARIAVRRRRELGGG